jgi:hypothetical protein
MHEMKHKMILRIWGQGSPKLGFWLQRYGENSFRDLCVISRNWLGLYLKIYSECKDLFGTLVDCGLILDKNRGLFIKLAGIIEFGIIFEWRMWWTRLTAVDQELKLVYQGHANRRGG